MKHILLLARHFNALNGGIGKYAENVYESVKHHYKYKPVIIQKVAAKRENLIEYLIYNFFQIPDFLKHHKQFDLYHAISPLETFWCPKNKTIVTFHDLMPLLSYDYTPSNIIKKIIFFISVFQAKRCKRIICVSDKTKNELIQSFTVDKSKIIVIPNMVGDELKFAPYRKKKKTIIGFISKIDDARKRILEFIDVFKQIDDPNLEFHFAGIGTYFEKVKRAAKGDKRIKVYGRISDTQKQHFFADLDLLVVPSKDEGFCIPIIEALKVGRPVLIFNDCTLPKEIRKLCFSEDFTPAGIKKGVKKAKTALKSKNLPKSLSKKAEKYSSNNISKEIIQEYDKLLK